MKKILNTKLKDMKAITLVALVITIVVLIILAGVIINITIGNGGIIDRTKTAKEQYQNAESKEQADIAKATNEIEYYSRAGENIIGNKLIEVESTFSSGCASFLYPEGYNKNNTYIVSKKALRNGTNWFCEQYSRSDITSQDTTYLKDDVIVWELSVSGVSFTTAKLLITKIN